MLMISQPKIDIDSPVSATAVFDPPVAGPGQTAIYRVTFNALEESITREEGNFRYKVADKQNTRAELGNLVAGSPDRRTREQAWRARAQIAPLNGARSCFLLLLVECESQEQQFLVPLDL